MFVGLCVCMFECLFVVCVCLCWYVCAGMFVGLQCVSCGSWFVARCLLMLVLLCVVVV